MGPRLRSPYAVLFIGISLLLIAGCTSTPGSPGSQGTSAGSPAALIQPGGTTSPQGPGNCASPAGCAEYCSTHHEECDRFCQDHPDTCSSFAAAPAGQGGFGAGTACDSEAIKVKFLTEIRKVLVSPPSSIQPPNWMTKVLPAGNPYPGYYYDLSTAFGPAIDPQVTGWSGTGEPPRIAGLDYYTFGYWEEVPKGSGGHMGEQTPDNIDLPKYQLAVFFTNVTGKSQAAMIDSLPDLSMTEAQARAFFASKIRKSYINLDGKTLTRSGNNRMFEARWHDSDETQDYWDVQIGTGYIAIGQGKVYTAESMLQGDPGTMWRYTACRPCEDCSDWTVETAFNRDCSTDTDCLGGLSCRGGYCVDPGTGAPTPAQASPAATQGGPMGGKGPGASCRTAADCGTGLSCTNGACSVPAGRP